MFAEGVAPEKHYQITLYKLQFNSLNLFTSQRGLTRGRIRVESENGSGNSELTQNTLLNCQKE